MLVAAHTIIGLVRLAAKTCRSSFRTDNGRLTAAENMAIIGALAGIFLQTVFDHNKITTHPIRMQFRTFLAQIMIDSPSKFYVQMPNSIRDIAGSVKMAKKELALISAALHSSDSTVLALMM